MAALCRIHIKGAGQENSDERPVVPVSTLVELLDNVPQRYRALLLLVTFANLRFGELARFPSRSWRNSAHRSVIELEADIRKWINEWNKNPRPFVWTKTVGAILETLAEYCQRIIDSGH